MNAKKTKALIVKYLYGMSADIEKIVEICRLHGIYLIEDAGDEVVAILNHNVASAYLVPSSLYEKMMEIVDDYYLAKLVEERLNNDEETVRVELDDLLKRVK
ncbi:DegT/DnrJ/EryC1/StrS family aminotransferase [Sulfurimonas indica]|uniref:DegT/DnrJ/EryC1/StrS family aminotransferase n=1 Tax=Sulfurimonas indica TaxID=2508707 RepID=UPI00248425AD|nr:DegT/DnrJ/EryC1/StrS family aminotransferase [Sulfurimonas indica]